jgi:hypothetical protein
MKTNLTRWILSIVACAALAVVTGCPDATGSSGGPGNTGNTGGTGDPSYIGQFTNTANSNDVVIFEVDGPTSASASIRAAGGSTGLTGKLKDQKGVYKLSGTATVGDGNGTFTLSANGKDFRYIIKGTIIDNKPGSIKAQVYKKASNSNGDVVTCQVSEHKGGRITGTPTDDDKTNTFSDAFVGTWGAEEPTEGSEIIAHRTIILVSPCSLEFILQDYVPDNLPNVPAHSKKIDRTNLTEIVPVEITAIAAGSDGSAHEIIGVTYGLVNLDNNQQEAVNTEFESYLHSKGITATRITDTNAPSHPNYPKWNQDDVNAKEYMVNTAGEGEVWCRNFAVDYDWLERLNKWRSENFEKKYVRFKTVITNGKMNVLYYKSAGGGSTFDTIAAAKDATQTDSMSSEMTRQ